MPSMGTGAGGGRGSGSLGGRFLGWCLSVALLPDWSPNWLRLVFSWLPRVVAGMWCLLRPSHEGAGEGRGSFLFLWPCFYGTLPTT